MAHTFSSGSSAAFGRIMSSNNRVSSIGVVGGSMRLGLRYCTGAVLVVVALLTVNWQSQTTTSGVLAGVVSDRNHAVLPTLT
jgi:hypothetical protein